jgi:branched-chain amino acid transport system ATP-binding protein
MNNNYYTILFIFLIIIFLLIINRGRNIKECHRYLQEEYLSILEVMFPNLYERRSSPGGKLSGGEQQMLAIARILRTGASLLLLDEITEGLAPVIIQKLTEVVRALKERGFTIILVEQNFRFASKLADRNYVIEHGQVVKTVERGELEASQEELKILLGV